MHAEINDFSVNPHSSVLLVNNQNLQRINKIRTLFIIPMWFNRMSAWNINKEIRMIPDDGMMTLLVLLFAISVVNAEIVSSQTILLLFFAASLWFYRYIVMITVR